LATSPGSNNPGIILLYSLSLSHPKSFWPGCAGPIIWKIF
jgi:hypothetical protein